MRRKESLPKFDDWTLGHRQPVQKKTECNIVKCPQCGKRGCMSYILHEKMPGYKVLEVIHAHFLRPTFEQRRNYFHILNDTAVKCKLGEVRISRKLIKGNVIPQYILDKFT